MDAGWRTAGTPHHYLCLLGVMRRNMKIGDGRFVARILTDISGLAAIA
jgi:hypothetical protein